MKTIRRYYATQEDAIKAAKKRASSRYRTQYLMTVLLYRWRRKTVTRTLDSFAEVGWKADNGCYLRVESIVQATVSVTRNHENRNYDATIILQVVATGEHLATITKTYSGLDELTDMLGIDDTDVVWEVLDA